MDQFVVNIIHRPEMVPEYAEKVTGQGKAEDIGRKSLLTESLDIFKVQQECAHKNGLKTTIQMTYASLFNQEAVELAKEHHAVYGDEIALSLLGLPCEQFREKYKTKDFCIWMFSMEDKKAIVHDVFSKFYEIFGFYPKSTGSYYMDADLINFIKAEYPMVKCAVATCWEEGPKAYHTCNNSWYTFMDGGPWAPWIPSKQNTHAPAANEAEDSGIVAIPHLSRDLIACYDGNGSNFGTHPQNVLRGMIYDTETWEFPYLYNLIDQFRYQAKFNDGYAYNMMFVGPGWMNKMGRWEAPYELLLKSYEEGCAYYGKLKKEGKLLDMTMEEFADFYREKRMHGEAGKKEDAAKAPKEVEVEEAKHEELEVEEAKREEVKVEEVKVEEAKVKEAKVKEEKVKEGEGGQAKDNPVNYNQPECALWRDILYGSKKQVFWYCDPYMRACINMDQGGAIVDLRPHAAKLEWPVGIGTAHVQDASYPFLIQEKYRAGYFTHYAGEGTVYSAKVCCEGEEVDLCLCRTKAHFSQERKDRILTLEPVEIVFGKVQVKLQTVITFTEGSSRIRIDRNILSVSDPEADVRINEYMVGCYGTTEYTEDMTSLALGVDAGTESSELSYAYRCREEGAEGAEAVWCKLPPIRTRVSLTCEGREKYGYIKEGYAFSPMFTLGYTGKLQEKERFTTWLSLERED